MNINLENYLYNFRKTNAFFSNFLKEDSEWFHFLCFSNICFEGNYFIAKENWEESLVQNNNLCDIVFEDFNNEVWYFIKFIDEELIKESQFKLLNDVNKLEKILTENIDKNIFITNDFRRKIEDFNSSEFKENRKVIYLCSFFNQENINKLNLILKQKHQKLEFEIFSERDLLNLIYERKDVPRFGLRYNSLYKNEIDQNSKISYFTQNIQGIVLNIEAKSYFKLYSQHKNALFSKNVREYFKSKEDLLIKETIKSEPENFWFFNNGVTILCQDYKIDESDTIILENFSVINGAQTISLIGENYNSQSDPKMYVLTKIIKYLPNKSSDEDSNQLFTEKIVQFTNNQKPIKSRDLKSNKLEMIRLKKELRDRYDIVFIIKRGDVYKKPRLSNDNADSLWKYISNEVYAQIFLAMLLQQPDKAIQSKSKIFSQNKLYNNIFNQEKFQIVASKIIIYNYFQIQRIMREIIADSNNDTKIDIIKRLKMWIYAYITLLSLYINNESFNFDGKVFFNYLNDKTFEIQDENIGEIKNDLDTEVNIKYFINIFLDEAANVWKEYQDDTRNKKSKNLLAFSYNHEQYLKLMDNIFSKYFHEKDFLNKRKLQGMFDYNIH